MEDESGSTVKRALMQSAGKRNLRGMSVHGYMGMTFCCALALLLGGSTAFGVTNAIHTDQRKNRPINRVFQIPHGLTRPSLHSTMSAPIQGVLMEVKVAEGALVKKGQILAIMDNRVALAEVKMARVAANQAGEIEHAKYELTLAESLLIRLTALEKANAGAQYELEEARVRRDQATVGVRSAREQMLLAERKLEVTEARLESHNIRAPFSGKIIRIERAAGTTMTPSDDLLTLVNMDSIEAELFLPLQ